VTVSLALVRRLAFASLLANVGIVLTGGAVRLTGSGLGCPTWPTCTDESWTATGEMGLHGLIEFGNRTLTFLLGAIAVAGLLAAWRLRPRRRSLTWLAAAVLTGIGVQGLLGGITVWTDLNPWIVGAHFLVSIGIIAVAHTFWRSSVEPAASVRTTVPGPLRWLARVIVGVTAALLAVGTVVTGSGPHAGDKDVPRNGLDPEALAQAHSQLAFLLLGLAVAGWFAVRAAAAGPAAARAAAGLVAVLVGQGALGLAQYFTGLPELLVWLHLLGSCLVWLAALNLLHHTGTRPQLVGNSRPEFPAALPVSNVPSLSILPR
jgi:cytochrome c oxidase assembly protein subunit 15